MNARLIRLWATKNKDDEWWSSFVTSPLAIAVNYVVVDIKWLTPNLITLFSFITAVISALFIVAGGTINFIIAAILIHCSHVLDCMDGQMARYRNITSLTGAFFDKLTDQLQISIWFGAIGYAAYAQSHNIQPMLLAFIGIALYSIRGYSKYVTIYLEMTLDNKYLDKVEQMASDSAQENKLVAGLGFGVIANLRWLIAEQRKVFAFDEGVFIFMLSLALIINSLTPMLWVFASSQVVYCLVRTWQRK